MEKVSRKEFYERINPLNVTLRTVGNFPYGTEFRLRHSGKLIGKAQDFHPDGHKGILETNYYLGRVE